MIPSLTLCAPLRIDISQLSNFVLTYWTLPSDRNVDNANKKHPLATERLK